MKKEKDFEKRIVIKSKLGLHARPAALFVQTANRFNCEVTVIKGRQKVNGKSIMGIMTLAAGKGSAITVITTGSDAKQALDEIVKLFDDNFGEDNLPHEKT
ncbi:MAG: HPr family phosphocarrier protein [Candidatus Omnitrophica bacterium]|nr:HPr family phosphocarrier protein [Candidatus Omnitrophota bacterium]